jgi:PAS domain-containing protein
MAATMEYRYEALAQQSEALRIILESLPWGVIVADLEGRLLFSNPAAERILGIGNVEVLPDTRMALEGWYLPDQFLSCHPINCLWFAPFAEKSLSTSLFSGATHNRVPEFGSG